MCTTRIGFFGKEEWMEPPPEGREELEKVERGSRGK